MIYPVVFGEKYVVICDMCQKRSHQDSFKGFSSYDDAIKWMETNNWEYTSFKSIKLDLCPECIEKAKKNTNNL